MNYFTPDVLENLRSCSRNPEAYTRLLTLIQSLLTTQDAVLQTVFESVAIIHFTVDASFRIMALNQLARDYTLLHWGTEPQVGDSILDYVTPQGMAAFQANCQRCFAGEAIHNERQVIFQNGFVGWFEMSYIPVRDPHGNIIAITFSALDITEHRQVEQQLRASEHRLRAVFEGANIGISVSTDPGQIISANPAYCQLVGYTEAELQQMYYQDYTHPDDIGIDQEQFDKLKARIITSYQFEKRYIHKNGKVIWVQINISLFPSTDTDEKLVIAMAGDITQRRLAEENLRTSEERMELALKGADLGLWDWDLETDKPIVNERWAEMIGYRLDEIEFPNVFWQEHLHPDDAAEVQRLTNEHLEGRTPAYMAEYRLRAKNGEWRWIMARGKVVKRAADGRPLRMVGTHLDITDQKQMEQQLLELAVERERVSILSNFIRDTSHEFRTPLSIINTRLYLLERSTNPAQRQTYMDGIRQQVDNIVTLLESLVLMSRLDEGGIGQFVNLNIYDVLRALDERVRVMAEEQGVSLDYSISGEPLLINGDFEGLYQALLSILDNALRYTPAGGQVMVRSYVDAGLLVIEVRDTGIGIRPDELPYIFDSFYRADQARTTRGFGLGLSIARRIIQRHGGAIDVQSAIGIGTTFLVRLPLRPI